MFRSILRVKNRNSGCLKKNFYGMMEPLAGCAHIRTRGLMTMAPLTEDKEIIRRVFQRLRGHFERIKEAGAGSQRIVMEHLSMGMSADYEIAIEEGATMVRIAARSLNNFLLPIAGRG